MITFKQYLQEARYSSSASGQSVVNKALEAIPRMLANDEQVFVSKFKDDPKNDEDIFFRTLKELMDRFGEPEWKKMSSEAVAHDPYWRIDDNIELLLHHVGISVIIQ